jgi:hypothetical protein
MSGNPKDQNIKNYEVYPHWSGGGDRKERAAFWQYGSDSGLENGVEEQLLYKPQMQKVEPAGIYYF